MKISKRKDYKKIKEELRSVQPIKEDKIEGFYKKAGGLKGIINNKVYMLIMGCGLIVIAFLSKVLLILGLLAILWVGYTFFREYQEKKKLEQPPELKDKAKKETITDEEATAQNENNI